MNKKKLAVLLGILVIAFSLTACGGDDKSADEGGEKVMEETSAVVEEGTGNNMSDEGFIATVQKMIDLLAKMEAMSDEEAMASMTTLFELSAKLEGFDDARAEAILAANPELKAAIEALNSVKKK